MFLCFLIIDGIFKNLEDQVKEYQEILFSRILKREHIFGDYLMPQYYYVPPEYLKNDKEDLSTIKLASHEGSESSTLFLMGQAVLIITQLLTSELLHINELDPIRRYMPSFDRTRKIGRYSTFQVFILLQLLLCIIINYNFNILYYILHCNIKLLWNY